MNRETGGCCPEVTGAFMPRSMLSGPTMITLIPWFSWACMIFPWGPGSIILIVKPKALA
jgi:hypothetical protein